MDPETGEKSCSQRFEWSRETLEPQINNPFFQHIPIEAFKDLFQPLLIGEPYYEIVSRLPDGFFKESQIAQDIKSFISFPIMLQNEFYGFIGFDDCRQERNWTNDEISFLSNITSNLAAAIQRRTNQLELAAAFQEKQIILGSIRDGFFTVDKNWTVTYWNNMAAEALATPHNNQLDDKAKQYIHYAVDGARRIRQKILDLLEFSKIGKQLSQPENIVIKDVVHEVSLLHRRSIQQKKATIKTGPLPTVKSFYGPLLQIFQNLISNSLKYSKKDISPVIEIQCESLPDYWKFSISDNGIGVDPEYHNQIFVIFQRLHTRDEFEGTGMGLSIVKKIIENLGGNIWIESCPGEGNTFYFTIPKNIPGQKMLSE